MGARMTDLFGFDEALEERKGIMADSNIHDDALAYTYTEAWRHECEVRDIVNRNFPDGHAAKCELDEIEKKRGKESADKLRADCRVVWAEVKAAGGVKK